MYLHFGLEFRGLGLVYEFSVGLHFEFLSLGFPSDGLAFKNSVTATSHPSLSLSPFWNLLILVSKPQSYLEISVLFLVFESPSLESCQFLIMILLLLVLLIWHCLEPDALW